MYYQTVIPFKMMNALVFTKKNIIINFNKNGGHVILFVSDMD